MVKSPKPAASRKPEPEPDGRPTPPLEGEVMDHVEKALQVVGGAPESNMALQVAMSRAALTEQITTAKAYPRGVQRVVDSIINIATLTQATADACQYGLPRGYENDPKTGERRRKIITGPSIRLMEIVANQWGNNDYGVESVDVDKEAKVVRAIGYHHDLETNSKVRALAVRRITTSSGKLYDDDMIAVTGNAAGSIALRNAVARGIPAPIWGIPYARVQEVIKGDVTSLAARRVELLTAFQRDLNMPVDTLYRLLAVKGELDIGLDEMVHARAIYSGLRNNEVTLDDLLAEVRGPGTGPKTLSGAFAGHDLQTGEVMDKQPAKQPVAVEGKDVVIQGPAPAGVVYFLASIPTMADGNRVHFKDGESDGMGKPSANVPVYTEHAVGPAKEEPAAAEGESTTTPASTGTSSTASPSGTGSTGDDGLNYEPTFPDDEEAAAAPADDLGAGFDEEQEAEAEAEEEDQTPAAFSAFAAAVAALGSWTEIKGALKSLRATDDYKGADAAMKHAGRLVARNRVEALRATGHETVDPRTDPEYYALWLDEVAASEVPPVWSALVRTPAYQKLSDAMKDALADATRKAAG